MDKNTEKYLRTIINESYISDVEEMAFREKGMRKDSKPKKFQPIWKDDNPTPPGKEGIPDAWILNPSLEPGKEKIIVPLDCDELNEFVEKNKEWLDGLSEQYNFELELVVCNRTKYQPRNYKTGTSYQPSGEMMSESERINRKLKSIIASNFESEEFSEILNKRSIPAVLARDRSAVNTYGEFSNNKILYQTHNYNSYGSVRDFLNAVRARINGSELPEMKTYTLARQFNKKYRNWDAAKPMEVKPDAEKTDVYQLNKLGYTKENFDVTTRMDLTVDGSKLGNSFTWNVRMKTILGKKLSDEPTLKGGFLDDKLFQESITAQIDPNKQFTDTYTILDDINVVNALIQAIDGLKSQIEALNPKENLKAANIKRYQIKKDVNESLKNELVNRIVRKLKK